VLDGRQLHLAVGLADCPGHGNPPGFYAADEPAEILREAIR
jgi:hypothetical protein